MRFLVPYDKADVFFGDLFALVVRAGIDLSQWSACFLVSAPERKCLCVFSGPVEHGVEGIPVYHLEPPKQRAHVRQRYTSPRYGGR